MATQDESAVRATIDHVYTAWRDHDPDAFVAPYAERAIALHPGSYLRNRDAIRSAIVTGTNDSEAIHDVESVRFLGEDAALVISRQAVRHAGEQAPSPESRSLTTWVLSRAGAGWQVEAFHSLPEAAA